MPGILPMKVIKVGTSSQSRISQACDRCRAKRIRCDGLRPTCSQCTTVGLECKTSDKLSRRAFPRGYTESLEERIRQLEGEVRELKDLLDEKDEKIDMLSRMHGNHRPSASPPGSSSTPAEARKEATPPPKEDTFRVQASPLLLGLENSDSYFMGPSSGRSFIELFKRKLQESGKPCPDFNLEAFLHIQGCYPLSSKPAGSPAGVPSRLFTDRCVNIYFQEWAPLFPVLHKPSFLRVYEEFVADPEKVRSNDKIAQLYLVFGIAALSSESPDGDQIAACEQHWQRAVDAVLMENTIITLQCLVLALMYCTLRADYKRLQHYKGVAVGLSHRLGLHQSQKRFSFGALTIETRKRVFWTLYTLDCFSGAILGLPKLLKEDDIHAEYPSDTDDEYVTEKGFQPTLPGECTRLSSALALFRCSRILAKVLEKNYPAATSHELSLQQMASLGAELDEWSESLPAHLKLTFAQDKPSTNITGSRSPLLALAYYYTRTLIYRPAVGSSLGPKAAPALISIGDSSKHIIQIIQLLQERNMSFSFCLNKTDVLVVCGMTLLYQSLNLKQDSKLAKDVERLVNGVIKIVSKEKAAGTFYFQRIASVLVNVEETSLPTPGESSPEASMPAPPPRASPPLAAVRKKASQPLPQSQQHHPLGRLPGAAASDSDLLRQQEKLRRMTMPASVVHRPELHRVRSRPSMDSVSSQELPRHRDHRASLPHIHAAPVHRGSSHPKQHLDYLSLGGALHHLESSPQSTPRHTQQARMRGAPMPQVYPAPQPPQKLAGVSAAEWEALLGSMDGGLNNVYDAIYGGQPLTLGSEMSAPENLNEWSPDTWDLSGISIAEFGQPAVPTQSALSVSEESLSSGEDAASADLGLSVSSIDYPPNVLLATCTNNDGFVLDSFDGGFGL